MLSGDFYEIQSFTGLVPEGAAERYRIGILLNPAHPIYQGHFPDNPVVPGVCQIQMIKEFVEKAVDHSIILTASDNIKFLALINPNLTPQLDFQISVLNNPAQQLTVTAFIESGNTIFLKFKGKFEIGE